VTGLSPIASNYIKLAALLVVGFCVGTITMLVLRLKLKRSLFSFKNLVIVGIFPGDPFPGLFCGRNLVFPTTPHAVLVMFPYPGFE